MTDREKIIKIIEKNGTYNCRSLSFDYYVIQPNDLADALIAAGLKFDRNISYTATFNLAQLERINDLEKRIAKAEHHAARAERALYNACCEQNKHWCVQCDSFAECDTSNEMCIEAKKHAEELIKQAEKELAEEKKDAN